MKFNYSIFIILFFVCKGYSRQVTPSFQRHVDSSAAYLKSNVRLSKQFLDSIINPSEKILGEKISEYYYLRANLENEEYAVAASIQHYIKSLYYAEKYKDYTIAAMSAAEIASNFYNQQKDSLATIYYDKAFYYYSETNDQDGLLNLMQFPAYAKYANLESQESIDLVLKDLEMYKKVEGDQMYYSFAIFLLTSSYLHLNDIGKAHQYNRIYRDLKGNEYIEPYYYSKYENAIKSCFAEYYFENENLDSIKYYLDAIKIKKGARDFNVQKNLYRDFISYYKLAGNTKRELMYLDSLKLFNEEILQNTIDASIEINDDLSSANLELSAESSARERDIKYKNILLIITAILVVLSFVFYRKIKNGEFAFSELKTRFSSLKSKEEKLAVKNVEFQEFFTSLRKEVKRIAALHSVSDQKSNINNLYKQIHLNHSNFVNSEDHYKLLSAINKPFFDQIEKMFPHLDHLEIQICYYLFTGFKNREIASFTNRSLRAVEGKRYRIVKKLNLDASQISLKSFLDSTFTKMVLENS